jgi:hypothetical protein
MLSLPKKLPFFVAFRAAKKSVFREKNALRASLAELLYYCSQKEER